jgi:hypothetical protein
VTAAAVAASVGALLIGLSRPTRDSFINPRPLSSQHSGAEFAHLASGAGGGQGCVLCHAEANSSFSEIALSALASSRGSLRLSALAGKHPRDFSRMDHSCIVCHAAQSFHQADVAVDPSCTVCHREHQGAGPMAAAAGRNCVACHGDRSQMEAARERSQPLPSTLFARRVPAGPVVPAVVRPAVGYTEVITDFATDHPEFRVLRERSPDNNTLRFNHRLHLTGSDIPPVNGRALDCAYCHHPDASGAFMARISFEQSCRACHALDFDEHNPGMTLPHGDAAFVRSYLRSLPVQYADYASRILRLAGQSEIDAFVRRQIHSLREREGSGESLERDVFMGGGPGSGARGAARARFTGCALCHDVAWHEISVPQVTQPLTPDRWLLGASFSHAAHGAMACAECHAAASSALTSDVILPTQRSCVRCHSPKGGASDSCTSCHIYHNPAPQTQARDSLTAAEP